MLQNIEIAIYIFAVCAYLDFCLQYGNIFWFVHKRIILFFAKGKLNSNLIERDAYKLLKDSISNPLYKVLGGCVYCYQFWIGIIIYFFCNKSLISQSITYFCIVGMSFVLLKLYKNAIKED